MDAKTGALCDTPNKGYGVSNVYRWEYGVLHDGFADGVGKGQESKGQDDNGGAKPKEAFDFDEVIDRRGTDCAKWDLIEPLYGVDPADGLSMWVADMDFRAPPSVQQALEEALERGIYGYHGPPTAYKDAAIDWLQQRHGWAVDPEWITVAHGLVSGLGLCIQAFSEKGDGVIVFSPVYHAFERVISANDRRLVESELQEVEGRYVMDLEALGAALDGSERIVVLCSPHNPGGRVWTAAELRDLAEFCARHDLILICDEVHHDLVYPGHRHVVTPLAAPDHRNRMVICAAASKTFNLAGGMTGSVIIENEALRSRYRKAQAGAGLSPVHMGMLMTTAAYRGGADWLEALLVYLDGNRRFFDDAIAQIPGLRSMALQATYLAWVDVSALGLEQAEIERRMSKEARIAANYGPTFGKGGEGWLRFNLATPRSRVEEAVRRLERVFAG